jgi:hypothetical protein
MVTGAGRKACLLGSSSGAGWMVDTSPVIRHVETHLGLIDPAVGYWAWNRADGSCLQLVAFRNQPRAGATSLCSLGLGHHQFCSPRGHVRQELILTCWDRFVSDDLARLVPVAADYALDGHVALSPGRVLGPAGPLITGSGLQALLCLEPFLHHASFAVCTDTQPATELIWLVPISVDEAREAANGHGVLLSRWEQEGVDLLDWYRA